MLDKRGVLIISFDLPVETKTDKSNYRKFIKEIKNAGFLFIQESLYYKEILDISNKDIEIKKIKRFVPKNSDVMIMPLNLSTFSNIEILSGDTNRIKNIVDKVFFI